MRRAIVVVPFALFCLATAPTSSARADEPYDVRLGEVSAPTPNDARLVRTSLEAVLGEGRPKGARRRLVVSASLLACDDRRCVVSATLREERGGNVIATVQGSARARGPGEREGLLKAAAAGAGRGLPRALP